MAARDQRRKDRRRGARRIGHTNPKVWIAVGVVGSALVALLIFLMVTSEEDAGGARFPNIGDHWHASYSVTICGDRKAAFPPSSGGSHTHPLQSDPSQGDGVIHIHPQRPTDSGRNATLARFIAGTGSRLTDELLKLPSGNEYKNGDLCPDDQPGQVFLRVNNIASAEIASYVPRDEDRLELGFGPQ